jgi:hypothetical protein
MREPRSKGNRVWSTKHTKGHEKESLRRSVVPQPRDRRTVDRGFRKQACVRLSQLPAPRRIFAALRLEAVRLGGQGR